MTLKADGQEVLRSLRSQNHPDALPLTNVLARYEEQVETFRKFADHRGRSMERMGRAIIKELDDYPTPSKEEDVTGEIGSALERLQEHIKEEVVAWIGPDDNG
jgi:hypothetical protein